MSENSRRHEWVRVGWLRRERCRHCRARQRWDNVDATCAIRLARALLADHGRLLGVDEGNAQ